MNNNVFSNFVWRFLERWGAQGVTLIVGLVLANILGPKIYGSIALVTVFTTILQVFVDSGLGTALIQKKDADDLDFSSVFWFNICVCVLLYLLMFLCAPVIATFCKRPELVSVIRVLSLILIISGVKNIQQSYVEKNLMFKKFFFATLSGTLGAAVVGITMALLGFGVWALVAQTLFNATVDTLILWITVKWRPKKKFSIQRFKQLFSYGWKILASSLINTFYNELRSLIIGAYYSSEDLAFYNKGSQFPKYAVENINSSMNSVLLPVLSRIQGDVDAIRSATRKVIRCSSYIIWPLMVGLCMVSDKLILVLLNEDWLPASIFLKIICFNQVLQPLQTTNLSVIKAMGYADKHLKLEIVKKAIAISIVFVSAFMGVEAIAIGSVIYAIIASFINAYPNKKLIQYSYYTQIKDIFPFIAMSSVMALFVYFAGMVPLPTVLSLIFQILVGVIIYSLLSLITKSEELKYYIGIAVSIKNGFMKKGRSQLP